MAEKFTVTGQRETVGLLPDGTYGQVVRVTFVTTAGDHMSVDVPSKAYSVDNVRELIEQRVADADAITNL